MAISKEMLKKQATENREDFTALDLDISLSNSTTPQPKKVEVKEIKEVEPKKEVKVETSKVESVKVEKESSKPKKEKKTETLQMLSFRLPPEIIEKIDKYAYVERETKQDTIIRAFEKFFNSKEVKEILSQYDSIKK